MLLLYLAKCLARFGLQWQVPSFLHNPLHYDTVSRVHEFFTNLGTIIRNTMKYHVFTAHSELQKVIFLVQSVCVFLLVYEISLEPLNGPRLDEFEGERSRSQGEKNGIFQPFWRPACGLFLVKRV